MQFYNAGFVSYYIYQGEKSASSTSIMIGSLTQEVDLSSRALRQHINYLLQS